MDIIPIAPLPHQDIFPASSNGSAADGESGFAPALDKAIAAEHDRQPARRASRQSRHFDSSRSEPSADTPNPADSQSEKLSARSKPSVEPSNPAAHETGENEHTEETATAAALPGRSQPNDLTGTPAQPRNTGVADAEADASTGDPRIERQPMMFFRGLPAEHGFALFLNRIGGSAGRPQAESGQPHTSVPGQFDGPAARTLLRGAFAPFEQTGIPRAGIQFATLAGTGPMQQASIDGIAMTAAAQDDPLAVTVETGTPNPAQNTHSGRMPLVLAHLQELVGSRNDTVRINVSFNAAATQSEFPGYLNGSAILQTEQTAASQSVTAAGAAGRLTPAGAETPLQPIKADGPAQHFTQVIEPNASNGDNSGSGSAAGEQGGRESSRQHAALQQQFMTVQHGTSTPVPTEQAAQSGGFGSMLQDATPTPGSEGVNGQHSAASTTTANIHRLIQENDVINQIVQRFSIQSNLQTNRLSLTLHPAELGELKIDVVMKHDVLKANIYAQTQQAKDIIEKHLPRLRSILQENGMAVEDLFVFYESDTVDDYSGSRHNTFQEQDGRSPGHSPAGDEAAGALSFAETMNEHNPAPTPGVDYNA